MSRDELVARTRISRKSLEALEADNPEALGSSFYFHSFAKQMADALQLEQNADEWRQAVARVPVVNVSSTNAAVKSSYTPRVAPLRARRESGWHTASPVLSFVILLIACSGLYTLVKQFDFWGIPTFQKAGASLSGVFSQFSPTKAGAGKAAVAGDSQFTRKADAVQSARPDASREAILLKIAAVERTWLSADADGRHVYSGLLDASDTKELEGRVTAKIRTGNAGGLKVTFNGKHLGTLGEHGQVRTVVFTRDQYQILAPNLTSRLELLPAVTLPRWFR